MLVKRELEGVTDLKPADDDFQYMFTVRAMICAFGRSICITKGDAECVKISCTSCREEHPKPVTISLKDEAEISGSKGTANFVWRCSNCKVGLAAIYGDFPLVLEQAAELCCVRYEIS